MGFNMVAELEGTEAFRRAWEMHPDIVVTDLALPPDLHSIQAALPSYQFVIAPHQALRIKSLLSC